ncbi:hypothetical protein NMY22_g17059 [Coprinellus aureogranulatus]|nr:hypothetical protein NMY22_g17059 [Coprinellus aureogranulatus]
MQFQLQMLPRLWNTMFPEPFFDFQSRLYIPAKLAGLSTRNLTDVGPIAKLKLEEAVKHQYEDDGKKGKKQKLAGATSNKEIHLDSSDSEPEPTGGGEEDEELYGPPAKRRKGVHPSDSQSLPRRFSRTLSQGGGRAENQ